MDDYETESEYSTATETTRGRGRPRGVNIVPDEVKKERRREYHKKYYENHAEEMKLRNRLYYEKLRSGISS